MVDAVVTWVDGNDPAHRQKRRHYLEQELGYALKDQAATADRFDDAGELWFCLHLIRKNAPWIDTVFLVTDDQRPAWLTEAVREALGVRLVDHSEIFREHADCLPTFNSNSIENVLFNVPTASNRIVYFNDDTFLIRPTRLEDFFDPQKVVVRARTNFKSIKLYDLVKRIRFWDRKQYVGRKIGLKRLPSRVFFLNLAHTPHALDLDLMAELFADRAFLRQNIGYRFRAKKQIAPVSYTVNMMASRYGYRKVRRDWEYLSPGSDRQATVSKVLEKLTTNQRIKMLCVQSLCDFDTATQARIKDTLHRFLATEANTDSVVAES